MRHGVTMFVTDRSMTAAALARAVEERGLDGLYLPEHTHIPVSRKTPYPLGGELPDEYKRTLDPFVALATAAAVTSRIRLGIGVCLVAQRDPIILAKEVASLDHVSGGRFVLGIGTGWNEDELEDHGVPFKRRRTVVRERVLAMRQLWEQEVGCFEGEFVHLSPSWAWPKPVQKPRAPIFWGGAASPKLFEHIAEYADGWMPLGAAGVAAQLPALHEAFERAGRNASEARVILYGVKPERGRLDYFASMGAEEVVFFLPSAKEDRVLPVLDEIAKVVKG
jgi:probable F420-dependent oxidoreductase